MYIKKIVSKVISNRLSKVLPDIIGISQTCSIRERSIFDNVHLLRNDVVHETSKRYRFSAFWLRSI
jgi:hypothetical protein